MTLDGHMQAPGLAARKPLNIALGLAHLGQQGVGQTQQPQTCAGKAHWLALAHKQAHAEPFFQILDLMRQGRLGQMQTLGGFNKAFCLAQGSQGAQVAEFKHGSGSI